MITLSGILNVTTRGTFLHCRVGRFVVNDSRMHDVALGKHSGFFEIQTIEPTVAAHKASGQVQLGVLAILKGYSLQSSTVPLKDTQLSLWAETDCSTQPVAESENLAVEPVEEDREEDMDQGSEDATSLSEEPMDESIAIENEVVAHLELPETISLPEQVTLDWTLPRDQLRQEIRRLEAQGYQFQKDNQSFFRAA